VRKKIFCLALFALGAPLFVAWTAAPIGVEVRVVDERGVPIRDAVVELDPDGGWNGGAILFPWRAAMAQKDIAFTPGTLVVAKGASVAFPNLDKVRHSVYSFSKAARFEIDLYGRDQTRSQDFPLPGTVALGCNIHDEMRGYIRVVDTPYAGKTDQSGIVKLTTVPAGGYQMNVWHPRARTPGGEFRRSFRVSAGQAMQTITLSLR
jgi:hypothetical protein